MQVKVFWFVLALGAPSLAVGQSGDSILNDEYVVSEEFVEGEVVQIRPRARTITLRGANRGDRRQFTVPEGSRVTVNGRPARLRDIRRGDSVMVSVVRREQRLIVDRMRVPESDLTLEDRRANPIVAEQTPAELPKTASARPMLLVGALLAICAASILRIRRRWNRG